MGAAPKIKSATDFNAKNAISEMAMFCRSIEEPVCITGTGNGDIIVMSRETYERSLWWKDVCEKLDEAEGELQSGKPTIPAVDALNRYKARFGSRV